MYKAEYPVDTSGADLPFLAAGIGKCSSQRPISRSNGFDLYMIFYTRHGSGILYYLDDVITLKEGDVIILSKDTPYEYHADGEEWHTSWITFSGRNVQETLSALKLDGGRVIRYDSLEPVNDIFRRIFGIIRSRERCWTYTASALIYTLLTELSVHLAEEENASAEISDESRLKAVYDFIEQNFRRDITLEEMAEAAEVTPEYFCRLFRRHANMRPFEYVAKMRISEAKLLLETTDMPVSEIGKAVGYHDKSYFGSVFKRYEGVSPTVFRGVK
ncbi:MAG: AraC family transcriptional regulator [Oscillospiraceae bacterium]|nr:AraC family transcriptional regulator [Oscillospiraceae bacterium]